MSGLLHCSFTLCESFVDLGVASTNIFFKLGSGLFEGFDVELKFFDLFLLLKNLFLNVHLTERLRGLYHFEV